MGDVGAAVVGNVHMYACTPGGYLLVDGLVELPVLGDRELATELRLVRLLPPVLVSRVHPPASAADHT